MNHDTGMASDIAVKGQEVDVFSEDKRKWRRSLEGPQSGSVEKLPTTDAPLSPTLLAIRCFIEHHGFLFSQSQQ
jgi:hypothetical protein